MRSVIPSCRLGVLVVVACALAVPSVAFAQMYGCAPGQVLVDAVGHCCSPGQAWNPTYGVCVNAYAPTAPVYPSTPVGWAPVAAPAFTPAATVPASQVVLDIRYDAVAFEDFSGSLGIVPGGLGLGLGVWNNQYYLGGFAVGSAVLNLGDGAAAVFMGRAAIEGRYVIGTGTGSERINHGDWHAVPTVSWVGLAIGPETYFNNIWGAWAQLEIGYEIRSSFFNIGLILGANVGLDSAAPFGGSPIWNVGVDFSIAFGFRL